MKTSVTDLGDSRVRVEVDVPAEEVDRGMSRAARSLARDLRVPGFRKGKAPPSLIIQRVGRGAVLEQAVRDSLPDWYERALIESGVSPVGDPSIEVTSVPEEDGEPLSFKFEVGVLPQAELGDYRDIEVGRAEAEVPDDVLEAELERVRESFARLETVERKASEGDFLLIDFVGEIDGEPFEGGEARDYLLELGGGQLLDGFEQQLEGAAAGEEHTVEVSFPVDYRAEQLAGKDATFKVTVKEVREKVLPDLNDEFALNSGGFDTLEELRGDIRWKLREAVEQRIESDFRLAAVDAAVDASSVEVPDEILDARAAERWERMERQLSAQGVDPSSYMQMQDKTREEIVEESKPDAERELKREAVLRAIADAEQIDVSEEEMVEALGHTAEHERTTPEELLERLRRNGRDSLVREDLRVRKAIDLLAESASPIPVAQAEARERLWTPEKERQTAGEGGLWTPESGSEE
jgi:trigger factor